MKYSNKWMVVPFNPNYLDKSKDTVSNQLTKALESSSNPIEKLNRYNQVLVKSKDQHHPVVPKQEEDKESVNDEEDNNELMNDFSINTPNLFLPPPTLVPNYLTPKRFTFGKSKVPPPYPRTVKNKTRAFNFYNTNGYVERPDYNESNPKKRKIIELDKSIWNVYRN